MTVTSTAQTPEIRIVAQGGTVQTTPAAPARKRNRKPTEELKGMLRRMLKAWVRRAAEEDPWVVKDMLAIRADLDKAIDEVVAGLVARGYSWNDIAQELGMTRQAAWKRWGK